jgi:ketosteroid isomerase-like protein
MEFAKTPEYAIQILDRAFNEGDLDTIMDFYDEAALVVPQPGVEARGKDAIREMYRKMLHPGMVARQLKIRVLEADGIALFISRWSLSQPGQSRRPLSQRPCCGNRAMADGKPSSITHKGQASWNSETGPKVGWLPGRCSRRHETCIVA